MYYVILFGVVSLSATIGYFIFRVYIQSELITLASDLADAIETAISNLALFAKRIGSTLIRFIVHLTSVLTGALEHVGKNMATLVTLLASSLEVLYNRMITYYRLLLDFITDSLAKFLITMDGYIESVPRRVMQVLSRLAAGILTLILDAFHSVVQFIIDNIETYGTAGIQGVEEGFMYFTDHIQPLFNVFETNINTLLAPIGGISGIFNSITSTANTLKSLFDNLQPPPPFPSWESQYNGIHDAVCFVLDVIADLPYVGDFSSLSC